MPVRKNPWVRTAGTRSPDYSDKDDELPWLSYQHVGNLVGNLTDLIVLEQNWQLMIDEIWNTRQVNDYTCIWYFVHSGIFILNYSDNSNFYLLI